LKYFETWNVLGLGHSFNKKSISSWRKFYSIGVRKNLSTYKALISKNRNQILMSHLELILLGVHWCKKRQIKSMEVTYWGKGNMPIIFEKYIKNERFLKKNVEEYL
jgi:hypothetical protein